MQYEVVFKVNRVTTFVSLQSFCITYAKVSKCDKALYFLLKLAVISFPYWNQILYTCIDFEIIEVHFLL